MYDIVIIGGGPGGYVAAIRAAQMKARVALVEADRLGGTCLNRGCIPTKALVKSAAVYQEIKHAAEFGVRVGTAELDLAQVMTRKQQVVDQLVSGVAELMKGNGVEVFYGKGSIPQPGQVRVTLTDGSTQLLQTKNIIIATGSSPARLPIPGLDGEGVLDSDAALALQNLPASIVIIGGGVIGIELAGILNAFGVKVTVVEVMPFILPMVDQELVRRITPTLKKSGLGIMTKAKVLEINGPAGQKTVKVETGNGVETLEAEAVLVATGRVPNFGGLDLDTLGIAYDRRGIKVNEYLQTTVPGIYAIGDVIGGIMLAHVASHEGVTAIENILGNRHAMDYKIVPNCIFSFPEIGAVGLGEKEAKDAGIDIVVGKFPFVANGKALTMGEREGIVKVIAEKATGRIVGVHILGPHATDLVHEGALAIKLGATLHDLAETIHAHPTLSEATMEAALQGLGRPVHVIR